MGSESNSPNAAPSMTQDPERNSTLTPLSAASLAEARRFYAEELRHVANVSDHRVVAAFASVPREHFVPPGPWQIYGTLDGAYWQTPDDDPHRLYHNVLVALLPDKRLNNGEPSLWAWHLDRLGLRPGQRVLQIGSGLGYYTAILAELVGGMGQVRAIEIEPELARAARDNLAPWPQVEVIEGSGLDPADGRLEGPWDAIIAFAGAAMPVTAWHTRLAEGGTALQPLTTEAGGIVLRVDRRAAGFAARAAGRIWIYPCLGARDKADIDRLGHAFARLEFQFIRSLRLDPHDADGACWLHGDGWCLSCREP
jgi:protein-L-isoaspartate(D-aspartate) O-methyltransferase